MHFFNHGLELKPSHHNENILINEDKNSYEPNYITSKEE